VLAAAFELVGRAAHDLDPPWRVESQRISPLSFGIVPAPIIELGHARVTLPGSFLHVFMQSNFQVILMMTDAFKSSVHAVRLQ